MDTTSLIAFMKDHEAFKKQLADQALDAACLVIQKALDVKTGDMAGIFFLSGEIQEKFIEYIDAEFINK